MVRDQKLKKVCWSHLVTCDPSGPFQSNLQAWCVGVGNI